MRPLVRCWYGVSHLGFPGSQGLIQTTGIGIKVIRSSCAYLVWGHLDLDMVLKDRDKPKEVARNDSDHRSVASSLRLRCVAANILENAGI